MATMGKYCKAYMIPSFREFSGWTENVENSRKDNGSPRQLTDSDFLYLQENYFVTDGIFVDENIIFNNVTPEWIDFCKSVLKFTAPEYASAPTEKTNHE
jgi:hypothetical protein